MGDESIKKAKDHQKLAKKIITLFNKRNRALKLGRVEEVEALEAEIAAASAKSEQALAAYEKLL